MSRVLLLTFVVISFGVVPAIASCSALPCYAAVLKVTSCEAVDFNKPPFKEEGGAYQGVVITSRLLESVPTDCAHEAAVDETEPVKKLAEKNLKLFYRTDEPKACRKWFRRGSVIRGKIAHACCDGDPNPPCLLGFSAYLYDLKK